MRVRIRQSTLLFQFPFLAMLKWPPAFLYGEGLFFNLFIFFEIFLVEPFQVIH